MEREADMAARKSTGSDPQPQPETVAAVEATPRTEEAKSRFNAALEEAKAGASVLTEEAKARAGQYRDDAKALGQDWTVEARTKAGELAEGGKQKASEALSGLSRVIDDNAATLDEKLGAKYGDYARSASRALEENARKLDEKSLEQLADDSRSAIRKSPAAAVGLAALIGFLVARMFR